ncbi:uncharacterized protein LOC113286134 [Papaver somniferum]|uniref:uncharacterized protein LOC113286134 n=1 Tax=Papaver somniferum TaxID=3469 RepID=UPI000E6F539E|nr:uncharacterized protein LOC113286134 [Papaver somniferum]XP_026390622.1 uncharacterized protein LOC113286134 [Papaver somniferum]XP_026390623.1 uncharacterized protein LOC113286134 [Papaver somniferum]
MIKLHLSILRVLLNEKKRISDAIAGAVFDHGRRMVKINLCLYCISCKHATYSFPWSSIYLYQRIDIPLQFICTFCWLLIFIAPNRILKELRRPILDPPTSSNAERCGGIDIGFCNSAYNIFTH